jgi:two-component system chemotaxis sensor kinase CheA
MDDITKEFLVESYENLDRLDRDLVVLEKDPHASETLGSIFRTMHTLKGGSGFLGFGKLESVAHVAENLLSKLRDGVMTIDPEITSALLATVDAVRFMLEKIEATGQPGDKDFTSLIGQLTQLNNQAGAARSNAKAIESERPLTIEEAIALSEAMEKEAAAAPPAPALATKAEINPPKHEVAANNGEDHEPAPSVTPAAPAPAATVASVNDAGENRNSAVSESTIRVDVGLLDKLMNLVGELVLTRNQVLQITSQSSDSALQASSQRLNQITTELQGSVMKTRMQPIGNVWSKLPRVVRDLATACGKQVRVEMEGKETELDKTIIEAIKDPLTHIVRNSADHGIEKPDVRVARGKPEEGCLKMRAYHEGGQVNIEISDDGGGIDLSRVKQKALQRGLITAEQAAQMSDHEALQLIFLPGFSTAEKITNVSGRGVGMDVVKTNIEKIGGTVDLQSQAGVGTTLKIKIPLTLAIIPALIVTSGGDRFAIPQVSLLELVRLEGEEARQQIEFIQGAPVYRLRGRLLPLAYLNRELQITGKPESETTIVNIVVLQADGHPFVKPLGKHLKGVASFAGATIMGDGRVALILDVLGLALGAGVVAEVRDRSMLDKASSARKKTITQQALLLFDAGQGSRMAIPLSMVARLEEFPKASVEHSGAQEVVRYRGQILPLIRVSKHVPSVTAASMESDPMQVVVYSEQGRSVGLIVGRINDIVQEAVTVKRHAHGQGIFGSVVIQDTVTDLLDVKALINAADPFFYGKSAAPAAA